ncbi:hypothetical protein Fmac_021906 [Flemingia macrophylla]|uniref:Cation/H+ exchanger transmembrane domain-containing protein n=1 Tax=Flemingia macrophylla TaxID=520843 RepID=A0ABD1LYA4_9FABA
MAAKKPTMKFVARRYSTNTSKAGKSYVCLMLLCVMVSSFVTDMIGIHTVFGMFVFGVTVLKGALTERVEDFALGLLLPMYFELSGLKTNVATVSGTKGWGLLALVITTMCTEKVVGMLVMVATCRVPSREVGVKERSYRRIYSSSSGGSRKEDGLKTGELRDENGLSGLGVSSCSSTGGMRKTNGLSGPGRKNVTRMGHSKTDPSQQKTSRTVRGPSIDMHLQVLLLVRVSFMPRIIVLYVHYMQHNG